MDMSQYLDIFIEEAKEHLQDLNTSLLELEKDPNDNSVMNEIFRVAHTIKGMAGTMGFTRMTTLTHDMEDVLDGLRNQRISVKPEVVDILFQCLDALESYVAEVVATGQEGQEDNEGIIASLAGLLKKDGTEKNSTKQTGENRTKETGTAGLRLSLNQYDKTVIEKAIEDSLNIFQIYVELDKKCLLKAARAFIIFQILDRSGEIMKSDPSVEDIEDEKFDYSFTVMVVTERDSDYFDKELNSVAEVRKVEITAINEKHTERIQAYANQDDVNVTTGKKDAHPETNGSSKSKHKSGETKRSASKTVRVDIERLDVLMNLVSELIITKTRLEDVGTQGKTNDYHQAVENLERITTSLHDAVMKVRMVPIETVFSRFPRMVRDISKELKKDIVLHMSGEETELDRSVIDEIGDPLIHAIRNSADHGLEQPADRLAQGKEETGNIWLRAYQDGNNVVIEVEDDGRGIDIEKVRRKVIEKGLESEEAAAGLSDNEIVEFLFRPNFSTADKVTEFSGRGVGLDVVKTKIEALGGTIELSTSKGKGSRTTVRLPLTLAIIQALLVRIGEEKYAIPLNSVSVINNVDPSDIQYVSKQEVIMLRGAVIPIIRLNKVLGVSSEDIPDKNKQLTCVIAKKGDKLAGLIVDSLIGQQEIVIKSLGKLLSGIRCIAGATILGDGNVALIIDVNSIV